MKPKLEKSLSMDPSGHSDHHLTGNPYLTSQKTMNVIEKEEKEPLKNSPAEVELLKMKVVLADTQSQKSNLRTSKQKLFD